MSIKTRIANLHYRPGPGLSPWLWPLLPLSTLYQGAIRCRLAAYQRGWLRSFPPSVPLISIGNLTTGGTGKTPIVIELAQGLIRAGKSVVILSRGYGARQPVPYARALDPQHGDEAFLIQEQVPEAAVIVGRNRVQTYQRAIQEYRPDFVLLDDGFQYLSLGRTLNIALIDGQHLLGNQRLLPAGPLREPLDSLHRADLVFVTQQVSTAAMRQVEDWLRQYGKPDCTILPVAFRPTHLQHAPQLNTCPLSLLQGRTLLALSGIAHPERFEQDLRNQNPAQIESHRFADHHVYTLKDAQALTNRFDQQTQAGAGQSPLLLTTSKDLPKLRGVLPERVLQQTYVLCNRPSLDGEWFYHEFLTQIPTLADASGRTPSPSNINRL